MNIQENLKKFKYLFSNTEVILILIIIGTAGASFTLGRMSVTHETVGTHRAIGLREEAVTKQEANVEKTQTESVTPPKQPHQSTSQTHISHPEEQSEPVSPENTFYVASKNGTKYHLPSCAGAKQIQEENKIIFNSKAEAEAAGYTPASNCKGI